MTALLVILVVCVAIVLYSYALYPLLLMAVARLRRARTVVRTDPATWPSVRELP